MTPVELNPGLWSYRSDTIHSYDPSGEGSCYVEGLDEYFDSLEDAAAAIDGQYAQESQPTVGQIMEALEPALKRLAAEAWATHPNNPNNRPAVSADTNQENNHDDV